VRRGIENNDGFIAASLLPPYMAGLFVLMGGAAQALSQQAACAAALAALLAAAAATAPPPPVMKECVVCLDDVALPAMLLLMPCAHRCVCGDCAARLMDAPPPARACPKCREPVTRASTIEHASLLWTKAEHHARLLHCQTAKSVFSAACAAVASVPLFLNGPLLSVHAASTA
jgi:hypothetical protein